MYCSYSCPCMLLNKLFHCLNSREVLLQHFLHNQILQSQKRLYTWNDFQCEPLWAQALTPFPLYTVQGFLLRVNKINKKQMALRAAAVNITSSRPLLKAWGEEGFTLSLKPLICLPFIYIIGETVWGHAFTKLTFSN